MNLRAVENQINEINEVDEDDDLSWLMDSILRPTEESIEGFPPVSAFMLDTLRCSIETISYKNRF